MRSDDYGTWCVCVCVCVCLFPLMYNPVLQGGQTAPQCYMDFFFLFVAKIERFLLTTEKSAIFVCQITIILLRVYTFYEK